MFQWSMGVSNNIDNTKLYSQMANEYTPIIYEEACHTYNLDTYPGKQIPAMNAASASKFADALDYMLLKNLKDRTWLASSNINMNPHRVALLSTPEAETVYTWLTTRYLLTDFSDQELNKLAELSSSNFDFDTIKQHANAVTDASKRSIAYLYAVVRDESIKSKAIKDRLLKEEQDQKNKLIDTLQYYNSPKTPFIIDTDYIDQLDKESVYIEELTKKDVNE
jgi:hypothetical protein